MRFHIALLLLGILGGCARPPLVKNTPTAANDALSKNCDTGIAAACSRLAFNYTKGKGVPKNLAMANALFEKACARGDGYGCAGLADHLYKGLSIPKDTKRAYRLYEKSCKRGYAFGCRWVGSAHMRGDGVAKDIDYAKTLFERACKVVPQAHQAKHDAVLRALKAQ